MNGAEYIQLPEFRYADPHVLRLSKVKVPDGLTEEEKIAWWEGYE